MISKINKGQILFIYENISKIKAHIKLYSKLIQNSYEY